MPDPRDAALSWLNTWLNDDRDYDRDDPETVSLAAIITAARNEALEEAAKRVEALTVRVDDCIIKDAAEMKWCAAAIRALKE